MLSRSVSSVSAVGTAAWWEGARLLQLPPALGEGIALLIHLAECRCNQVNSVVLHTSAFTLLVLASREVLVEKSLLKSLETHPELTVFIYLYFVLKQKEKIISVCL